MSLDTALRAETPEGIDILLRPVGIPARALAYAIDVSIRLLAFAMASGAMSAVEGVGSGLLAVAWFALEWIYPIVFELLPGAATPGKRVLGLQVTMDSGLPVTPAASVVRNLLRAADFLPFGFAAGAVSMLLRPDFRRIGDIAASTLVVHVDRLTLAGALPDVAPLAPRVPLSREQQVALLHLAGRAARLSAGRVDELAALAERALPDPDSATNPASPPGPAPRLLGVARWLTGHA